RAWGGRTSSGNPDLAAGGDRPIVVGRVRHELQGAAVHRQRGRVPVGVGAHGRLRDRGLPLDAAGARVLTCEGGEGGGRGPGRGDRCDAAIFGLTTTIKY